jgi:hypothetical protein
VTPCCGLEVQKPTQALKSVKDPDNTFDLFSKLKITLLSLIYFSWDIYSNTLHNFFSQISDLIFDTMLVFFVVQKLTQAFKSVKGLGNIFDLNPKWTRTFPSLVF